MKSQPRQLVLASALALCANCAMAASWTDSFYLEEGQSSPLEVESLSAIGVSVAVTNSDATVSIGTTTGEGMFRANLDGNSPRGTLSLGMPSGSYAPALWAGANVSFAGRETARDGWDYSALTLGTTNEVNVSSGTMSVKYIALPSTSNSAFTKEGSGRLAIGALPSTVKSVSVRSGSLSFVQTNVTATAPAANPIVWLAADHLRDEDLDTDGGTTYLKRWFDVRGADVPSTVDGYPFGIQSARPMSVTTKSFLPNRQTGPYPTVVSNGLNGKPVIDFGRPWFCKDGYDWASSDSAYMGLEKATDGSFANNDFAREGFIVVAQNSQYDVPVAWSHNFQFVHSGYGSVKDNRQGGGAILSFSSASDKTAFGLWSIDAKPVSPVDSGSFSTSAFKNGSYHLVSFKTTSNGLLSPTLIASDRYDQNGIGGVRVAEIIYYYRELTDAERTQTQKYLMDKWGLGTHPSSADIAIDSLAVRPGATLSYAGGGTLSIPSASVEGSISAESGTVAFAQDIAQGAVLHLDASKPSTLDTVEIDGKKYVKSWSDVRNNGFIAYSVTNTPETASNNTASYVQNIAPYIKVTALPTLHNVTIGTNSMPCVDLGEMYKSSEVAPAGNTAATMLFNKTISFAEGYIVYFDNNTAGNGQRMTIWGLSNDNAGNFNSTLVRGSSTTFFSNSNATIVKDEHVKLIALDGEIGSTSTIPSRGVFHQYTLGLDYAIDKVRSFGRDTDNRFGGIKVCEAIAFSERLDDTRRLRIEQYLMNKWFGSEHPSAASITKETTHSLAAAGGASISVTGDLCMKSDGSLEIGADANGSWGSVAVSGELSFDGPLAVTVTSESSDRRLAAGDHVLMSAGSMPSPGSFDDWTLTLPTSSSQRGKLLARDNNLVLRIIESGLIIIVK